jgi:hypothetical protein
MTSERSKEGYLLIDHRASPGFTPEQARMLGIDADPRQLGPKQMFEAPTITCSHCLCSFVINPDRKRERGRCWKCFHYLCDQCAVVLKLTGECRSGRRLVDEANSGRVTGGTQNNPSLLVPPGFQKENPNG